MLLTTPWQPAFSTAVTVASSTLTVPGRSLTKPATANGIFDMEMQTSKPERLQIMPFAVGTANGTGVIEVWGWSPAISKSNSIWVPYLIASLSFDLGDPLSPALVDDPVLPADARPAFSITLSRPTSGRHYMQTDLSGAGGASIVVPLMGPHVLQFRGGITTDTTSVTALFRFLDRK